MRPGSMPTAADNDTPDCWKPLDEYTDQQLLDAFRQAQQNNRDFGPSNYNDQWLVSIRDEMLIRLFRTTEGINARAEASLAD